ncbi:DNA polymerase theta-like protein [Perkinsela sp. CCAP 1560/4]|nr:DNA polymerase theta-like protein [Perkinsela sp. CCAP 1560/4]|eukprot:KNH07624.1 DNA polymerase theta-like protein [Perkinsela sp. CCAP 1560/4]
MLDLKKNLQKNKLPICDSTHYRQAIAECSRQRKLLLAYVQSDLHPRTQSFITGTLLDPSIVSIISEHFLIWPVNMTSTEGFQYYTEMGGLTFPFLTVNCRFSGKDRILRVIQGELTVKRFQEILRATITENSIVIDTLRSYSSESRARDEIRKEVADELRKETIEN